MNTYPRPTPIHVLSIAMAMLFTTLLFQARANVDLRLTLWHGFDFFYGDASLTTTNPTPVTYHRVESPNALIWQNSGTNNDSSAASLSLTNDLSVLVNEVTNGLWSLTLNVGDASEQQYAFSVDLSGVTTGLFGNAEITVPVSGILVATNQPLIEWSGPAQLPSLRISVSLDAFPYTQHDAASLPSTTTNWTPTVALPGGSESIFLNYRSNLYAGATFSVPTNLVGGAMLSGWGANSTISTYDFSTFTVPGSGSALGDAVDAPELNWTTGGDGDWFAQTNETSDGVDAAQSGPIGDFESSWIETTVEGPGSLFFSWGTFADSGDYLEVELNGYSDGQIDGLWGWDNYYEIFLDPGPNTIRWTFYNADPTGGGLWDAGFLDEVSYQPQLFEAAFELNIQRVMQGGTTYYLLFPMVSGPIYATATSPNGLSDGDDSTSSSAQYATLQAVIDEIEAGPWTISFIDETASGDYEFGITVDALTTNDLPPVLVLDPADGAVGIPTNTSYVWLGPASFDTLQVSARSISPSASLGFAFPSPTDTTWTNGPALPSGTNSFNALYTSNSFVGLTIEEPYSLDTGDPLSSWSTTVQLSTQGKSVFEAGGFAPVVLLPPMVGGGNFGLAFISQSGAIHYVEYKTNLVSGAWMPATNFPGDGTTNLITLPTTNPAAFYRIQTQ